MSPTVNDTVNVPTLNTIFTAAQKADPTVRVHTMNPVSINILYDN
jgi:hypothetical protein